MLYELFSVIAPVFICAGIGYWWERSGRGFDTGMVTMLGANVGAPCLVFSALSSTGLSPVVFAEIAGAATAAFVFFAVFGAIVLRGFGWSQRTFLPSLVFSNTGNMALPLCLLAFGETGLAFGVVVFSIAALLHFTFGVALVSGATSFGALVRVPTLWATLLALPFIFIDATPPAFIANTTEILGGMMIPIMLIALGVSLARLKPTGLGRSAFLSVVRLGMGFGVGVGVAALFGLEGAAKGVLIIQSAMPVAVFNYLFAQRYSREPEEVASMVLISTTVSFLTLPLLMWYVI
ncbi:MAG: AEC family transporter [Rhodospirillales bacterium]|nr:AEC family transporter [Rhodospirillales bacterium]MCW8952071.1 AEC family transporter [Rhodospirillales bacterium]